MSDEVTLKVKGQAFRGWTSVMIEKSMYQMVGSFGLATTDLFPGEAKKWNVVLGDECVVEINDQKIITGYVEDILVNYDASSHNIQFGGRDKTGDLVDCSLDQVTKEWRNLSIKEIIKRVCEPFHIDIVVDDSVSKDANAIWTESVKADEGDVVFDLITKICKMKAILPLSYSDGKLTLTRAGTAYKATDSLETGKNILRGSLDNSNKDRFQTYIVKGQGKGEDTKVNPIEDIAGPVGRITDEKVITRYRPIIVFAETKCDRGKCLERARWELSKRIGASRTVDYEVQGWTQSDGKIWPLNAMVQVKDDILGIAGESLLMSDLSFTVGDAGAITKMRLVDPNVFEVLPEAPKKNKLSMID